MHGKLAAGMAAMCLLAGVAIAAEPEAEIQELETILVLGEQPGPGLWKVSKGDHVMWVLASHEPLPKGMSWRSQQVEARIAESQEVLYPPGIDMDFGIGLFRGITLIPAAIKAAKIPDDKTLKDVLAPETYGKWLALRQKYIGKDDDVEKLRPSIALGTLRGEASRKHNLQDGPNVRTVVDRAAKKHKVRVRRLPDVKRAVKVENPRGMLKGVNKLDLPDVECFTRGLDQVEPEIERAKVRANAWSRGDTETLRSLHRVQQFRDVCGYELMAAFNAGPSADAARAKKLLADIEWHVQQATVQAQQNWIAAAQASIAKNSSTFAVLPVNAVFSPDGHLEKLRALGYTVEAPH
jgi:hypothetical protein